MLDAKPVPMYNLIAKLLKQLPVKDNEGKMNIRSNGKKDSNPGLKGIKNGFKKILTTH